MTEHFFRTDMKSILFGIARRSLIVLSVILMSQSVSYGQNLKVTLYVTSHPPPDLSDWTGRKDVTIVTILNTGKSAVQAKFNCSVSKDGAVVASTKPESMAIITIPVGSSQWFGEDLVPIEAVRFVGTADRTAAQTGKLPAGNYTFCVSLLDPKTLKELTAPVCKDFTLVSYQAPVLFEPANKSTLSKSNRPILRWSPVSPKPSSSVTYRVLVFEILQGQTPINAYKVNQPILDQQTGQTQLLWPADVELPQSGMHYVWSVQALDALGNPIGDPNGTATPFTFIGSGTSSGNGNGNNNGNGFGSNGSSTAGDNQNPDIGGTTPGNNNGNGTGADSLVKGNQPFTQGPNALTGAAQSGNGLTAVTPKNGERFTSKEKLPNFSWRWTKEPAGVSFYTIEVRQSESNKSVTHRTKTLSAPWPSDLAFDEGTYTWSATAMSTSGNTLGTTGSQSFSVMSNNYQIQYSVDSILCTDTIGFYHFSVTLCNTGILPITFTPSDLTALDDITGLPDPNIILTVTTPSSMITLTAPNCITISGTIKNLGTKLTGIIAIRTNRVGGSILASAETENDTLPTCICTKCDGLKIDTTKAKAQINPKTGHLMITQPLTVGPDQMTGLTADVIYVGWQPENPKCMPCDKDPKQWGVLASATFAGVAGAITPNEAHWTFSPTKNTGTATLNIVLPQLLDCCKLRGNVCIRYKFYLRSDPAGECYECERVICYSF